MKRFVLAFVSIFALLVVGLVAGCSSQSGTNVSGPAASTGQGSTIPSFPSIQGPSSPPGVKGPNGIPPGFNSTQSVSGSSAPQAVTETIHQKFTLN